MISAQALYIVAAAVAGLLIGSFLNVCIYRMPRDLSVVAPRSYCPECERKIAWFDNLPLISFALLRGRCRSCGKPIPWRYPLVEAALALLFGFAASRFGWSPAALKFAILFALLTALFWTDWEEHLLPDEFTLGGVAIGFVFAWFVPVHGAIIDTLFARWPPVTRSVANAAFGAFVFSLPLWGLAKLYERIREPDALGLGDIKLLALLGMFLGFDMTLPALMIGSIGGAIFGVVYARVTRQSWRKASLPFGAFLALGGVAVPVVKYW